MASKLRSMESAESPSQEGKTYGDSKGKKEGKTKKKRGGGVHHKAGFWRRVSAKKKLRRAPHEVRGGLQLNAKETSGEREEEAVENTLTPRRKKKLTRELWGNRERLTSGNTKRSWKK